RRFDSRESAGDVNVPGIVCVASGENPHQSGLSGTVLSDKRVNFPHPHFDVHSAHGESSNETLGYLHHANDGFGCDSDPSIQSAMKLIIQTYLFIGYRLWQPHRMSRMCLGSYLREPFHTARTAARAGESLVSLRVIAKRLGAARVF